MKKLKTLTAAATVGLAAFATTTAKAGELSWSGRVDNKWSTSGNWCNTGDGSRVEDVPDATTQIYVGEAKWNFSYDIVLDKDVEAAAWITYSDRTANRRFSGGHTLTINGTCQDDPFCSVGVQEVTGENTKLLLNSTKYNFQIFNSELRVTNGAQVVVNGYDNQSLMANATNSVIDGAYLEFKKGLNLGKNNGIQFNLINGGVLKIGGDSSLGNGGSGITTEMNIRGTKPAGGFLQVTSGTMTLGMGLKLRMTPELSWGDTGDAVVSYTGTTTGSKVYDDVGYRVYLSKLQSMPEDDEVTICLVSMNKGTLYNPSDFKIYDAGDLKTQVIKDGMKLYLRVFRHNWDSGVVTQAPTKRHGYKKTYRCTDDGCSHTKTVEVPNSQLPGDYLMTDGTGYFKTTYYPSYSNTFAEICVAAPELATAANRSLFFANDYTDGGTKGYDEWGVTYWADKSGAFYYESDNEGMIQLFADGTLDTKFHTLLVGGGKAQLDNGPTLTAGEPKPGTAGGKLYLCAVPYKSSGGGRRYTGKFNIRYLKIWEKVDDTETMKFWLVPGKNGNQATFFDLVTEKYLTPTSGTGFTIGDDPGGIMMYLR